MKKQLNNFLLYKPICILSELNPRRLCEIVDTFVMAARVQEYCAAEAGMSNLDTVTACLEAKRRAVSASHSVRPLRSIHEDPSELISDAYCAFSKALLVFEIVGGDHYSHDRELVAVHREASWLLATLEQAIKRE